MSQISDYAAEQLRDGYFALAGAVAYKAYVDAISKRHIIESGEHVPKPDSEDWVLGFPEIENDWPNAPEGWKVVREDAPNTGDYYIYTVDGELTGSAYNRPLKAGGRREDYLYDSAKKDGEGREYRWFICQKEGRY